MAEWQIWTFRIITIILAIFVLSAGLSYAADVKVEPAGQPLHGAIKEVVQIIFGGGVPDSMLYTYTFFQYIILPFLGAFILIFFLTQNILPRSFAAALAIIVVFIASYSGALLRFVHGTLTVFGVYGYVLVWVVLVISSTAWGIGHIGTGIAKIEKEVRSYEKEKLDLEKRIAGLGDRIDELSAMRPSTYEGKVAVDQEAMKTREEIANLVKEVKKLKKKIEEKETEKVQKYKVSRGKMKLKIKK